MGIWKREEGGDAEEETPKKGRIEIERKTETEGKIRKEENMKDTKRRITMK